MKTWLGDSLKEKIRQKLPLIILLYCVLQPILDVIGFWQMQLELGNSITMAIRMLLLGGSVLLGFLLSDRKRYYFLTAGVLICLTALHVVANLPGGYEQPVEDLVNLVRIYLMPLTVVCFITFLRQGGEKAFRALKNGMLINVLIIVVVELLSVLTGTDRETYRHEHIGVLGWFYWANSQSAILSMMCPIVICWAVRKWPKKLVLIGLFTTIAEVTLFFFGTRLTFGSMVASGFGVGLCLILENRRQWKQALVVLLVTLVFTSCYGVSPTSRRMKAVDVIDDRNQEEIHEVIGETFPTIVATEWPTEPTTLEEPDPQSTDTEEESPSTDKKSHHTILTADKMTEEQKNQLRAIYNSYLYGSVYKFGLSRVLEKYNYTTDASVLGNWRIEKMTYCELMMEDSNPLCRYFGFSLQDTRLFMKNGVRNEKTGVWEDGYLIYDVENDFHGVYFLLGIVGLALMCIFLLYFGLRALIAVIRDHKTYFTTEMIGFAGAYCFGLLHAYFTVSVLRRNNASVYMALVLVGLWYLSRKEQKQRKAAQTQDSE